MQPTNDNSPAKTIEQAKSELLENIRMAIASIDAITENLARLQPVVKSQPRSLYQSLDAVQKMPEHHARMTVS